MPWFKIIKNPENELSKLRGDDFYEQKVFSGFQFCENKVPPREALDFVGIFLKDDPNRLVFFKDRPSQAEEIPGEYLDYQNFPTQTMLDSTLDHYGWSLQPEEQALAEVQKLPKSEGYLQYKFSDIAAVVILNDDPDRWSYFHAYTFAKTVEARLQDDLALGYESDLPNPAKELPLILAREEDFIPIARSEVEKCLHKNLGAFLIKESVKSQKTQALVDFDHYVSEDEIAEEPVDFAPITPPKLRVKPTKTAKLVSEEVSASAARS